MTRWLQRLGTGIGACALCLAGLLVVEHFRGKWALQQRLTELRKQGEELSVAALEPKRPPADQNAALFLLPLTNRILSVKTNLENSPHALRFAAPGRAVIAWRLKEWSRDGKTTHSWNEMGSILNPARELLGEIHSAVEKPAFDSGFDYRKGFVDYETPETLFLNKNVAQLLQAATLYELSQQRTKAAHEHICALVRLVARQKPEPLIIIQLLRQACAAIAFNTTWQALQAPGWKEEQLATLQIDWQGCNFANDMAAALVMERAMTLDMFDQVRTSKEKMATVIDRREKVNEILEGAFDVSATHGLVLKWINVPLWRVAWADQDELISLNRWQVLIERQRIGRTNSWVELAKQPGAGKDGITPLRANAEDNQETVGWYDRFRFLFSSELSMVGDNLIQKTLCAQTYQQMVLTVVALKRYQLRTGKLPNGLSDLVPGYLPALPRDHMDGQSLRYRVLPEGGFVLYSVGEDGIDNGGDPTLAPGKDHYRQIWDGQDALWPALATDEEAASAMQPSSK